MKFLFSFSSTKINVLLIDCNCRINDPTAEYTQVKLGKYICSTSFQNFNKEIQNKLYYVSVVYLVMNLKLGYF